MKAVLSFTIFTALGKIIFTYLFANYTLSLPDDICRLAQRSESNALRRSPRFTVSMNWLDTYVFICLIIVLHCTQK